MPALQVVDGCPDTAEAQVVFAYGHTLDADSLEVAGQRDSAGRRPLLAIRRVAHLQAVAVGGEVLGVEGQHLVGGLHLQLFADEVVAGFAHVLGVAVGGDGPAAVVPAGRYAACGEVLVESRLVEGASLEFLCHGAHATLRGNDDAARLDTVGCCVGQGHDDVLCLAGSHVERGRRGIDVAGGLDGRLQCCRTLVLHGEGHGGVGGSQGTEVVGVVVHDGVAVLRDADQRSGGLCAAIDVGERCYADVEHYPGGHLLGIAEREAQSLVVAIRDVIVVFLLPGEAAVGGVLYGEFGHGGTLHVEGYRLAGSNLQGRSAELVCRQRGSGSIVFRAVAGLTAQVDDDVGLIVGRDGQHVALGTQVLDVELLGDGDGCLLVDVQRRLADGHLIVGAGGQHGGEVRQWGAALVLHLEDFFRGLRYVAEVIVGGVGGHDGLREGLEAVDALDVGVLTSKLDVLGGGGDVLDGDGVPGAGRLQRRGDVVCLRPCLAVLRSAVGQRGGTIVAAYVARCGDDELLALRDGQLARYQVVAARTGSDVAVGVSRYRPVVLRPAGGHVGVLSGKVDVQFLVVHYHAAGSHLERACLVGSGQRDVARVVALIVLCGHADGQRGLLVLGQRVAAQYGGEAGRLLAQCQAQRARTRVLNIIGGRLVGGRPAEVLRHIARDGLCSCLVGKDAQLRSIVVEVEAGYGVHLDVVAL